MQWFNQRTVWSTIRNFFSTQLVFQWTLKFRHASSLKKKKRRKLHQVIEDWYPPASSARSKSVKSQSNHLPRALTNPLPPITLHQRPPSPSLLQLNRRIFLVKRERVSRVSSNHPLSAYLLSRSSSIFRTVNRFWRSAGGGDIKGERKQGESRGNAEWEKEEEKKRRVGRLRWSPRKRTDNETTFPRFLPFRFHPPFSFLRKARVPFSPISEKHRFLIRSRTPRFSFDLAATDLVGARARRLCCYDPDTDNRRVCVYDVAGVTILLSQTVFSLLVAHVVTRTSEAVPLIGTDPPLSYLQHPLLMRWSLARVGSVSRSRMFNVEQPVQAGGVGCLIRCKNWNGNCSWRILLFVLCD